MKIHIKTVHEYSLILDKLLKEQNLQVEDRQKIKGAYLKIFKNGMDFANGCLKVEIDEPST